MTYRRTEQWEEKKPHYLVTITLIGTDESGKDFSEKATGTFDHMPTTHEVAEVAEWVGCNPYNT